MVHTSVEDFHIIVFLQKEGKLFSEIAHTSLKFQSVASEAQSTNTETYISSVIDKSRIGKPKKLANKY